MKPLKYFEQYGKRLYQKGYSPIPIYPCQKMPHYKLEKLHPELNPELKGWNRFRNINQDMFNDLVRRYPHCGIGFLTFNTPAIDIDVLDEKIVNQILEALTPELTDGIIMMRVGQSPKVLIPCRTIKPYEIVSGSRFYVSEEIEAFKSGALKDKPKSHHVDILCDGQQFVAYGIHRDTKKPYEWISEYHPLEVGHSETPMLEGTKSQKFKQTIHEIICDSTDWVTDTPDLFDAKTLVSVPENSNNQGKLSYALRHKLEQYRFYLKFIPATVSQAEWTGILMALHKEGEGRKEFYTLGRDWSMTAGNAKGYFDKEAQRVMPSEMEQSSKWRSFKKDNRPNAKDGSYILHIYRKHNPQAELNQVMLGFTDTKEVENNVIPFSNQPIPLPDEKDQVMPFDAENMLPIDLAEFVEDVAKRVQCPPDYVAVSALCVFASLLGNQVAIRPKQEDDWEVIPALWGMLIGNSSMKKSTPYKTALEPILAIEKGLRQEYAQAMSQYKTALEYYKMRKKEVENDAKQLLGDVFKKGNEGFLTSDDVLEKEAKNAEVEAVKLIDKLHADEPVEPKMKRLTVNDATIAKLGMIMADNPNGILYTRDELHGMLEPLNREVNSAEKGFIIESFDGKGHYNCDRVARGTTLVEDGTLSIIGTIQPTLVGRLLLLAVQGKKDDGFFQRFQLAVAPKGVPQFYQDITPNQPVIDKYKQCINDFYQCNFKDEDGKPKIFHFDEKAQKLFAEWFNENAKDGEDKAHSELYRAHIKKMPKTIVTLALIFELIKTNCRAEFISYESLKSACHWTDYLKSHAKVIYGELGNNDLVNARRLLAEKDKLKGNFTMRDIKRKNWSGLTEDEFIEEALEILIEHNIVLIEDASPQKRGRKTIKYCFNRVS